MKTPEKNRQRNLAGALRVAAFATGAIVLARIPRLVYGALDPKAGAHVSVLRLFDEPALNHRVDVTGGLLADESAELLRDFFAALRQARARRRPET